MTEKQGYSIPSNLFNIYLSYKQDTRAIVSWLVSHGTSQNQSTDALSIKDLFTLGRSVQKKAIRMPDIIHFHFRQAIKARTYLSRCFRRDDGVKTEEQSTCNHEFFTASLTKLYTELCECCGKPKAQYEHESCCVVSEEDEDTKVSNRFSSLTAEGIETDDPGEFGLANLQCESGPDNQRSQAPVPGSTHPSLTDDSLGEAVELRNDMQEIEDLFTVVTETWEQAGRGNVSFLVATSVSHAVFAEFETISHRLKTSYDIQDPEALHDKSNEMCQILYGSESATGSQKTVEILRKTWHQLLDVKTQGPKDLAERISSRPQTIRLLQNGPESSSNDDECIERILQDLARHMLTHTMQTSFYRVGSPVWADVGYFLTHDQDESDAFRCSFGLQLLLKSLKSYVFATEPKIQPSVCRIRALRFAQEALPNIDAVLHNATMPCRCPDTLAFHLERLYTDLRHFLGTKEFDFYFQSSWVSGSHMMEIAEALFYYGLRLFSYRNLVGSLLHVYNALRHFDSIDSIPLFDRLIEAFNDILFPGGRPSRNFKSCYVRHMGGRLHFHSSKHDSGCHAMAIPAHTAKATAGFGLPRGNDDPRFNYKKTSFAFHLKERDYLLHDGTWSQIQDILDHKILVGDDQQGTSENVKTRPCSHHRNLLHHTIPSCPRQRLSTLREALSSEFDHPFCTARINFFKVYLTCVRIVSQISDEYHGEDGRKGQRCLCFAENLLLAADRCRDNQRRFKYYCCKGLVEICQTTMVREVGDAKVEEFLWSGI